MKIQALTINILIFMSFAAYSQGVDTNSLHTQLTGLSEAQKIGAIRDLRLLADILEQEVNAGKSTPWYQALTIRNTATDKNNIEKTRKDSVRKSR